MPDFLEEARWAILPTNLMVDYMSRPIWTSTLKSLNQLFYSRAT